MKLSDYLNRNSISDPDFAALIGRDRTTVLRLRRENTLPDWETLRAIFDATGGDVTANDFLSSYVERREAGQ